MKRRPVSPSQSAVGSDRSPNEQAGNCDWENLLETELGPWPAADSPTRRWQLGPQGALEIPYALGQTHEDSWQEGVTDP